MEHKNGHHQEPPPLPGQRSNGLELPPSLPREKKSARQLPLGVLALLGVLLLASLGVTLFLLFNKASGSTENDELVSKSKQAEDYQLWRDHLVQVVTAPPSNGSLDLVANAGTKIGWWERNFQLPNEKAIRAALQRRLPEGFKLSGFEPIKVLTTEEGTQVDYRVKLKSLQSLYAIGLAPLVAEPKSPARAQELIKLLKATPDLPAGQAYQLETKSEILLAGQLITVPWTVRQAVKEEGQWKVLNAEPLYFQQDPAFETKLLATQGSTARLLRNAETLEETAARQKSSLATFQARLSSIQQQVAEFRQNKLAALPANARMSNEKFGGSGSGEPTKSAARIGGSAAAGAAAGAGFGAIGGDAGLGAGIGAGAGLLGGLIYDLVSKDSDKKKLEAAKKADYQRQLANRNNAVAAMNREVAAYEKQLYDKYEQELRAALP